MQQAKSSRGILLVYTSFVALCSLIVLVGISRSQSEPGSAVLFGLSLPRLVLALGFLSAFVFFAGVFSKAVRDPGWAERTFDEWFGGGRFSRGLARFAGLGLGLGWIGCFLPAYRAGILEPHWERIQPLMVFILVVSIATLGVFIYVRSNFSWRTVMASSTFRLSVVLLLASLLVLSWMLYSKYGVSSLEDFWYGAGVPLLASQWILAVLGGVLFLLIRWNWNLGRKDLIVFIVLYVLTAVLWAREPLQRSFLFTEPRPPNEVLYPFADAAAFDAGSQFALIGQGIYIFNSSFNDRPLYLSLLVYLHSLVSQNYENLMAAQSVLLAVFPPLIYLIGRSLNLRSVGFASALAAMFRGVNSIAASNLIDLASPKMILSDFPAAIGVTLIILFTCEWLKKPQERWYYAIWVGGAIGFTLMIRPHALTIVLFIPLFSILVFRQQWKKWLVACALIGLGVVAVTLPWELRNVSHGGLMYNSIVTKVQDVIRTRYSSPDEQGLLTPPENDFSLVTAHQTCSTFLCFTSNHFLHNALTSILILPTSPLLDDLWHTVKVSNLYWRADWQGDFTPFSLFFLILNLFLITLGISFIWKHQRLPGMVPLAIFVFYSLANSVARTSGGRYIVPMDWILSLYFIAGILFLFTEIVRMTNFRQVSILDPENPEYGKTDQSGLSWRKALLPLIVLFVVGSIVPLSEKLQSPRYADVDIPETLREQESRIREAGLDLEQLNAFLESPGAEALVGRSLYPRSYKASEGEVSFYFYPYTIMDYPRSGFFLIGPGGQTNILLPGEEHEYLPHAADTLVIGCNEQNYVDALMVIVLDDSGTVYTRSPMPDLTCPMKQP